jgi:glycosyltransferase involved in cell wall biosynthesis
MPVATVVIVTFNRKEDLRRAVQSVLDQSTDVEVLVLDDCSTDGTDRMMQEEFPTARYVRADTNAGYIVHRNRAADLATGEILFSLDDDAEFSTPEVVSQTVRDFDDPRIGAVAIPYIDVKIDPAVRQAAPDAQEPWLIETFRGTAYAVRKEVFIGTGRFRAEFRHQGEESDFCLRMLDRGYVVRRGTADPILHHESPKRDRSRVLWHSTRNWVVNMLFNYPMPDLAVHLAVKAVNGIRRGISYRMYLTPPAGMLAGYAYALPRLNQRRPVRRATLALFERMRRGGPLRLADALPLDGAAAEDRT